MNDLKTWAATLIVFSVIVLLYRILFPKGNLQKAGETVIALLMVFLMVKPIFSLLANDNGTLERLTEYDLYAQGEEAKENQILEDAIYAQLSVAGIEAESVRVEAELDAENYYVIHCVDITVPDSVSERVVYDCLYSSLEIPKEIIKISR